MRVRKSVETSGLNLLHIVSEGAASGGEEQVKTVGPGETIFLPKGKAPAFYTRSEYLRRLIISLATTEEPAALDSYFASMAKRAISMEIPTDAVTYLTDVPSQTSPS